MLDRSQMVSLTGLDYRELSRSAFAGIVSFVATSLLRRIMPASGRWEEILLLTAATILWGAVIWIVLHITGSRLPGELWARLQRKPHSL
jgi:hypothetical protein